MSRWHASISQWRYTWNIMKWYHNVTNLDMWHPFVAVAGVRQSLSLQMLSAVLNCRCLTRLKRALKRRSRFHSQLNYTAIGGTQRFIHQQIWYRFVNFPGVDIGQCGSMWIIDVLLLLLVAAWFIEGLTPEKTTILRTVQQNVYGIPTLYFSHKDTCQSFTCGSFFLVFMLCKHTQANKLYIL